MNWLDIVIILILVIGFISGYRKGFIDQLLSLAVIVVALTCAKFVSPYVANYITGTFGSQVSWLLAFVIIMIAGWFVRKLIKSAHGGGGIDGILGGVLSVAFNALILSVILNFFVSWGEKGIIPQLPQNSKVVAYILPISKTFMSSDLLHLNKHKQKEGPDQTSDQPIQEDAAYQTI